MSQSLLKTWNGGSNLRTQAGPEDGKHSACELERSTTQWQQKCRLLRSYYSGFSMIEVEWSQKLVIEENFLKNHKFIELKHILI